MNKLNSILNMVTSDMLMEMVQEVNSWNSSLEYLYFIDMEYFDEYMEGVAPIDIANKIHFGDFNPNDTYFNFNAYANLVSYDEWEVEQELETYKVEIVKEFIDLYEKGYIESTYQEVLDILDDDIDE